MKERLLEVLHQAGQQHLLSFWDRLSEPEQRQFLAEVDQVDWQLTAALFNGQETASNWESLARIAQPPQAVCHAADSHREAAHRELGESALREGRVGMILVAGGQGTRLGFPRPKGMLPLGPVSNRTLFQILVDRLRAVGRRYGVPIPLYLMTSPATHVETVEFFERHGRLGLSSGDLKIFCQGVMPVLDANTGRALLSGHGRLCLSPDGHGGMLAALVRSGCLADARQRGIDLLFYGQVDNPLLQVCDPVLLGCHLAAESQMTTQVVRKVEPAEKVGNVVEIGGRLRIIEYSDLPADAAVQRQADGSLKLWAGNLGVHVFERGFLERVADGVDQLPFHRAYKRVEFIDTKGELVRPPEPNAIKFERFIFDLLPIAERAAVVECDKQDAFAPVKNAAGEQSDTAQHAQDAMVRQHTRLLQAAGVTVKEGVPVEVNPLWALDAAEAAARIEPGIVIERPTYFNETRNPT